MDQQNQTNMVAIRFFYVGKPDKGIGEIGEKIRPNNAGRYDFSRNDCRLGVNN